MGVCACECVCLPGAILCTAVDVGPVIQQVLDYVEPATGARLMESTVTGVVSVVHLAYSVLQTVQNNLLKTDTHTQEERAGFRASDCVCVFLQTQEQTQFLLSLIPLPQEPKEEGLFA